ncbi:MAG: CoA transferase [Actinomycetota bacterium]|nr:CoA transferase [Actinomycetota bacterium]
MCEITLFRSLWRGLGGGSAGPDGVSFSGAGMLPSAFPVSELAAASVATAGAAVAGLVRRLEEGPPADRGRAPGLAAGRPTDGGSAPDVQAGRPTDRGRAPDVEVDRGLASLWFGQSFKPVGWELPPAWDAIAGDYECADGWIRLHTNAPHHRLAALRVLGLAPESATRQSVAAEVAAWSGADLESAVVSAGGCAAEMRSASRWREHPQGGAVAAEPLVHWQLTSGGAAGGGTDAAAWVQPVAHPVAQPVTKGSAGRPLAGVRVLDLTRVLAGPVATRFLAGYGAEVLRIDPPEWSEPALEPEMTLGKNCARLDLKTEAGVRRLKELLAGADILVHGYRPSALRGLGLGDDVLAAEYPQLVNVALDAYGWTGPWAGRRGFDSLVQMSCGIAESGMRHYGSARPRPLPVQALDHATGYLLAAAAVLAWTRRLDGGIWTARASLARTAVELMAARGPAGPDAPGTKDDGGAGQEPPSAADYTGIPEETAWGPGERLPMPVTVRGVPVSWDVPARGYGSAPARWK